MTGQEDRCHYCGSDVSTNYYVVEHVSYVVWHIIRGDQVPRFRVCNKCWRKHSNELRFVFRHTSALKESDHD